MYICRAFLRRCFLKLFSQDPLKLQGKPRSVGSVGCNSPMFRSLFCKKNTQRGGGRVLGAVLELVYRTRNLNVVHPPLGSIHNRFSKDEIPAHVQWTGKHARTWSLGIPSFFDNLATTMITQLSLTSDPNTERSIFRCNIMWGKTILGFNHLSGKWIRPPPALNRIPLYSPQYGGVYHKGLVTCSISLQDSISLAASPLHAAPRLTVACFRARREYTDIFKTVCLKMAQSKARIWPWLCDMCWIRSTAEHEKQSRSNYEKSTKATRRQYIYIYIYMYFLYIYTYI